MIGKVFTVPNQLKEEILYSFAFFYSKSTMSISVTSVFVLFPCSEASFY